ncbi:MAG TPA: VIT domain-containing protein [Planctomycetota bacterium]|jgi:predicted Zn-dependent protease|nr:VIT domain-containing protein [Planctomycetota bacterium]
MRSILLIPFAASLLYLSAGQEVPGPRTRDARVGAVAGLQGAALLRPAGRERWTPLDARSVLMPGDQVRTSARGANAVEIRLEGSGGLLLGPGGLIELPEAGIVRLYRGDLEIQGGAERPVHAIAPGGFERDVKDTLVLRSAGRATETLEAPPRWLAGFRSSTTDEWMGSLVALVDGRDVPLSVGYHKVTVEIRDQIARTTVEQSFVNSTDVTLEGVFHFPLPADASVSGFGMWIGDELVEADIVEKQRARAIYEDILRRRKDPGLLEWSGGNLFKARVFPIFAHSEKRILLRYTQVLPLEGATMRYRYALRSELLRSRPLRELKLQVSVLSTMPIRAVASPTHEARIQHSEHAASAEFDAQEVSPDRDFELALELDRTEALTVVPHRRAEDGYFMLLLSPPDAAAATWQRDLLPENGALEVLILADTSGSMDPAARKTQSAFVSSLLSLLGEKDRFSLMTCDVETRAFRDEPSPCTEERVEAALAFLEGRASLGWTDLDRAFDRGLDKAGPGTLLVYVGDGIGTTGDADPVALAGRLRRRGEGSKAVVHAVSTSSTYEKGVLEAIASVGGGSVRAAGDDPAQCAVRLLAEAAQPSVKDLRVSFEGLATARVYPERLPNLPAGTQQVVLGRFLPTAGPQKGRIAISGALAGRPVRYAADLDLGEGEEGNSFVPRLWARRQIDALLEEGRSKAIQEEIVACSEEFGIMTPTTSFLVLENDEDRERYGVRRRVKMRDGERFFAEGRDTASLDLLREQMKRAGTWRLRLRDRMLREIAALGRHLHGAALGRGGYESGAGGQVREEESFLLGAPADSRREENALADRVSEVDAEGEWREGLEVDKDEAGEATEDAQEGKSERALPEEDAPAAASPAPEPSLALDEIERSDVAMKRARYGIGRDFAGTGSRSRAFNLELAGQIGSDDRGWLASFGSYRFPQLPEAPQPPAETPEPKWPAEAWGALRRMDRRPALRAMKGGIELRARGTTLHPLRGHETHRSESDAILGPDGWFTRSSARGAEPIEEWVYEGKRGVLAAGVRLGRIRAAEESDRDACPIPLQDLSLADLARSYAAYDASLEKGEGGNVVVVLKAPAPQAYEVRLTLDESKGVLVESRTVADGKVASTTRLGAFVEAGGMWWATEVVHLDGEGRAVGKQELAVVARSGEAIDAALRKAVSSHGDAIFLGATDPTLAAAKQAAHEKRAGFPEHFALALHFAASGQWDRTWASWREAEATVSGKPGAVWLAAALMSQGRKGQELRDLLDKLALEVARTDGVATDFLATHVLGLAASVCPPNEMLALLDRLRPALLRSGEDAEWRKATFQGMRGRWLQGAGQPDQARALFAEIAASRPFDVQAAMEYLNALQSAGDLDGAVQFAERAVGGQKWLPGEVDPIYERWTQHLWERRDLSRLLPTLEAWIATSPKQETPYQRRLSTLLGLGREGDADAWVAGRLSTEGIPSGEEERAMLGAAVQFALGHGWDYWQNRIEEKWLEPLAALARRLISVEAWGGFLAGQILGDGRFQQSDACAGLRRLLLADLTAPGAVESMPLDRLGRYLPWIPWDRTHVDEEVWRSVTDRVLARWSEAKERTERTTLAFHVLTLLDAHGETAEAIGFLRILLAGAADDDRPTLANRLLDRLVGQEWGEPLEEEILSLLPRLEPKAATLEQKKNLAAGALRWVSDRLVRMREAALLGPAKEREVLPREALEQRKRESRAAARRGLVRRYAAERDRASEWARPWFELERLCFAAEAGEDPKVLDGEARELLSSVRADSGHSVDQVLRERCACVLAYAATRRGAPPGLPESVIDLFARLSAGEEEGGKGEREDRTYRADWRYHIFRLLVALDRPDELASLLKAWIVPAEVESRWRVAYGYLMAETGKLAEAVAAFEAVAGIDELRPREYQALADWYLALGDDARREGALLARHKVSPEHVLSNLLNQAASRLSRSGEGVPEELDPDTLRAMRALLQKASDPAVYVGQVASLYRTVKDFRLLESLADGVLGHTPEGIYPFLEQVGSVVREVHEEATCDALSARIRDLHDKIESGLDRRALQLLTLLVERRAAEVLNAPGPHAERGLQALAAAFRGTWLEGERRRMASFLASLGRIPQEEFASEQVRQLSELHRLEPPGTLDRLEITLSLHRTHWGYDHPDLAIDGLVAALEEFRRPKAGALTPEANGAVETLVGWLESRRHFGRAEAYLAAELDAQKARAQRDWLTQRLFQVYLGALSNDGALAIGRGAELFAAARERMESSMFQDGPDRIDDTLSKYCALHRAAHDRARVPSAGRDLERFAKEKLPELLTRASSGAPSLVSNVAQALRDLLGPRPALAFGIDRVEAEPAWVRRAGQSGWAQLGYSLGQWRSEVRAIGDLEPRLLRIVLRELEADLLSVQPGNRAMVERHNSYFWEEKAGEFAAVAMRVIEESPDSPARLLHAAEYLWSGLELRARAIETLLAAERRGRLSEEGRHRLVTWLHEEKRYGDSLPLLDSLALLRPDRLEYRILKIRALHEVGRDRDAIAFLDETERRFKDQNAWNEPVIATLARTCLEGGLHERSALYFEEVVPLHQRTQPNRGVGQGTLSSYLGMLAQAYIGTGKVEKAVDAASAAVVSWGPSLENRSHALQALRSVIERIPDLDAYAARREAQVKEAGLDAPVLRKAIGLVYLARKERAKAVPQLLVARDLQPNDPEVHAALLAAYDGLAKKEDACLALFESIRSSPMNLDLYEELGKRLGALGDPEGAERAWTGTVEAQPNEAESHRRLALHRENQRLFAEAVEQWRQVVRARTNEPEGWLALARAQVRAGDKEGAKETLRRILQTKWEDRFGDVGAQAVRILEGRSEG